MASLQHWVWLASLKGTPHLTKLTLLHHFKDPELVYTANEKDYPPVKGMSAAVIRQLGNKSMDEANRILAACDRMGIRIITIQDPLYPHRLRNIYNPPLLLYAMGRVPVFDEEVAVAMVGSRKSSAYALETGERLACELASHGALIVSGLALGGDAAAHRGALRAGGITVGVIAGGHDIIYPKENRNLYGTLAQRGAILSEYPPGTPHDGSHFPVRNRIISGLCLASVVLEAPLRSGTLITAHHALEQGRDVFAIPGRINDWRCAGSNRLLRDGAGIVLDAWDILGNYAAQYPLKIRNRAAPLPHHPGQPLPPPAMPENRTPPPSAAPEPRIPVPAEPEKPVLNLSAGEGGLDGDQTRIVQQLAQTGSPMQVDDIIAAVELSAAKVLSALTMLEIQGYVSQGAGKYFTLTVTVT